ncbi:MAG: hypothetical protein JXB43_08635 [Dehalococcoidia bacterium]|nr:hypothetical protein [Dehalococcoidia bacterium]
MKVRQIPSPPFESLTRAVAYLLGGIFLCTAGVTGELALAAYIIGGIFIGFAFFLVIVSLLNRFVARADSIHTYLFFALFVATVGRLLVVAISSGKILYIVLSVAFIVLLTLALIFEIRRVWYNLRKRFNGRIATIQLLRSASVTLSLLALIMVISRADFIGDPILHLALSLVCLSISTLL